MPAPRPASAGASAAPMARAARSGPIRSAACSRKGRIVARRLAAAGKASTTTSAAKLWSHGLQHGPERSGAHHKCRARRCDSVGDDPTGWEVTAAALKVQPEPTLTLKQLLVSGTRIDRMAGGALTMKDVVSREIPDAIFTIVPTVVLPPVYLATTYDPGDDCLQAFPASGPRRGCRTAPLWTLAAWPVMAGSDQGFSDAPARSRAPRDRGN
jgi:hypothetical protein